MNVELSVPYMSSHVDGPMGKDWWALVALQLSNTHAPPGLKSGVNGSHSNDLFRAEEIASWYADPTFTACPLCRCSICPSPRECAKT